LLAPLEKVSGGLFTACSFDEMVSWEEKTRILDVDVRFAPPGGKTSKQTSQPF